jgi:hypothetical protein
LGAGPLSPRPAVSRMSEQASILIIDDEPDLLSDYARILESEGYSTIKAATRAAHRGPSAITNLQRICKDIREFRIDGKGLHIDKKFRGVTGILAGNPQRIESSELERLDELFKE